MSSHYTTDDSLTSLPTSLSDADLEEFLERKNIEYLTSLTPSIVFLVCLTVIGLVGNCLVCLVYYKRFKPSATRTYILAISGCDLMSNVWSLPTDVVYIRFRYTYYSVWVCKLSWTVVTFLAVLTGLLLVAVAIDRQMRVCQGQSVAHSYAKKARKAVWGCAVLSFLLALPTVYIFDGVVSTWPDSNNTGMTCEPVPNQTFSFVYDVVLMVAVAASVTTMLVCYGRIAHRLWQHNRRNASRDRREQRTEDSAETTFTVAAPTAECLEEVSANVTTAKGHSKVQGHVSTAEAESQELSVHDHNPTQSPSPPRPGVEGKKIPTRTTLMLFVVTVVFILSYVPYLIVRGLFVAWKESLFGEDVHTKNLLYIMLRSAWLNSVINPYVYSLCSARFRSECRRLFKHNRRV